MGIVNYAINGSQDYASASKAENKVMQDTESYLEGAISRIKNAQIGEDTTSGDNTIHIVSNAPDDLKKFVLGENETGRLFSEIYTGSTFINESTSIPDAETSIIRLNYTYTMADNKEFSIVITYIRYNNKGYRIITYENRRTFVSTTVAVQEIYIPTGIEGNIVSYSVDGTSPEIDWIVLYDNGDTVDITPLEPDSTWKYKIGYHDPNAVGTTSNDKAFNSYNNAVERLNTYCASIVTNSTAQRIRSIGTQFDLQDTTEMYYSDILENDIPRDNPGVYNGVGKVGDLNYEQDVIRACYYSSQGTGEDYLETGYLCTESYYWLASRDVDEDNNSTEFRINYVYDGLISTTSTIYLTPSSYTWNSNGDMSEFCVRPVVRVAKSLFN